jgi:hypothetical protein
LGNPDFTWSVHLNSDKTSPDYQYQLIYNRYSVRTVGNPYFSVSDSTSGTLHAFTCVWPDAPTAPLKGDKSFDSYARMLRFISIGLAKNNNEGLGHLKAAFGID